MYGRLKLAKKPASAFVDEVINLLMRFICIFLLCMYDSHLPYYKIKNVGVYERQCILKRSLQSARPFLGGTTPQTVASKFIKSFVLVTFIGHGEILLG